MPIIEEIPAWKPCSNPKCWFDLIVLGGLISGLAFLAFEMAISFVYAGDLLLPLRLLSMPLFHMKAFLSGDQSLAVITSATATLMVLSIFWAYLFVAVVSTFPRLAVTKVSLITSACVSGYFLWILCFLLIALSALPKSIAIQLHPGLNGFIGFVFVYGMVLGTHIHRRQERRAPSALRVRFRF
ncbi:MAG: hypothetical protein AB9873_04075 [Syntrophobacteraceae bacterium]